MIAKPTGVDERERNARRLARTGRCLKHERGMRVERRLYGRDERLDRPRELAGHDKVRIVPAVDAAKTLGCDSQISFMTTSNCSA